MIVPGDRVEMRGSIVSSGFSSGDRVVVGHWLDSPVGPMTDVMWAAPDGRRTLFAPSREAAGFITGVYRFDDVEIAPFEVRAAPDVLDVAFAGRRVRFVARRGIAIPFRRPLWFTRWVEGPIARAAMGVATYGTSPTGVQEWYRADRWRPLRSAAATVGGRPLGTMAPVSPPGRFGFSEPPRRPSWVDVRPLLEYPPGKTARSRGTPRLLTRDLGRDQTTRTF